jgi:hypothetical protein
MMGKKGGDVFSPLAKQMHPGIKGPVRNIAHGMLKNNVWGGYDFMTPPSIGVPTPPVPGQGNGAAGRAFNLMEAGGPTWDKWQQRHPGVTPQAPQGNLTMAAPQATMRARSTMAEGKPAPSEPRYGDYPGYGQAEALTRLYDLGIPTTPAQLHQQYAASMVPSWNALSGQPTYQPFLPPPETFPGYTANDIRQLYDTAMYGNPYFAGAA